MSKIFAPDIIHKTLYPLDSANDLFPEQSYGYLTASCYWGTFLSVSSCCFCVNAAGETMMHNETGVIVRFSVCYLLPLTSQLRIVTSKGFGTMNVLVVWSTNQCCHDVIFLLLQNKIKIKNGSNNSIQNWVPMSKDGRLQVAYFKVVTCQASNCG